MAGILIAFGVLFLAASFSITEVTSCPAIIPGQPRPPCVGYYAGTNIPVPTVWALLDSLSVFCFGTGTTLFLITEYLARKTAAVGTPIIDAMIGTILVTATTGLSFGLVLVPTISGTSYLSLAGLLYGTAVGLFLGLCLQGLFWDVSPSPKLSDHPELQQDESNTEPRIDR